MCGYKYIYMLIYPAFPDEYAYIYISIYIYMFISTHMCIYAYTHIYICLYYIYCFINPGILYICVYICLLRHPYTYKANINNKEIQTSNYSSRPKIRSLFLGLPRTA